MRAVRLEHHGLDERGEGDALHVCDQAGRNHDLRVAIVRAPCELPDELGRERDPQFIASCEYSQGRGPPR